MLWGSNFLKANPRAVVRLSLQHQKVLVFWGLRHCPDLYKHNLPLTFQQLNRDAVCMCYAHGSNEIKLHRSYNNSWTNILVFILLISV